MYHADITRSQPFWGQMIAKAGAGPSPIPHKELTTENLTNAIRFCLTEEAAAAARAIYIRMESEVGVQAAVRSFHRQLPLERMPCDVLPNEPATWVYSKSKKPIKLSKIAAEILIASTSVKPKDLKKLVL